MEPLGRWHATIIFTNVIKAWLYLEVKSLRPDNYSKQAIDMLSIGMSEHTAKMEKMNLVCDDVTDCLDGADELQCYVTIINMFETFFQQTDGWMDGQTDW